MRTDTLDVKDTIATLADSVQWVADDRIVDDPTFFKHPLFKRLIDEGALGEIAGIDLCELFPDFRHRMVYLILQHLSWVSLQMAHSFMAQEAREHLQINLQAKLDQKEKIEKSLEKCQQLLFGFAKAMVDKSESGIAMARASALVPKLEETVAKMEGLNYELARNSNKVSIVKLHIEQLLRAEERMDSVAAKHKEQTEGVIMPVPTWDGDLRMRTLTETSRADAANFQVVLCLARLRSDFPSIFENRYDFLTVDGWEPNGKIGFLIGYVNVRLVYNGWRRMKEKIYGTLPDNVNNDLYFDWVMERHTPQGNRRRVMPVQWELQHASTV